MDVARLSMAGIRNPAQGRKTRWGNVGECRNYGDFAAAHRDWTDAGHDLALGQMPVAHHTLAAVIGEFVGMAAEQGGYFCLDRLRQQRSSPVAHHVGQLIGQCPWLGELENISLGHGLRWRSGGFEIPPRYVASIPHAVTNFRE
jgi:hypothetical protein